MHSCMTGAGRDKLVNGHGEQTMTSAGNDSLCVLPACDGVSFRLWRTKNFKVIPPFVRLVTEEVNLLEVTVLLDMLQTIRLVPADGKDVKANL